MRRILTAVILLAVLWVAIREAPPWAFFALAAVVIVLGSWECYALLETWGALPFKPLGVAASLALAWSAFGARPGFSASLPIMAVTVLGVAAAMWRRRDPASMLAASWSTLFPVLFVGLGLSYPIGMRSFPGEDGKDVLLLLLFCVVSADTAAFYVGSSFGRRKLAPMLSPRKTWEGALGGLLASVAAGLVAHLWFYQRLPVAHAVIIGTILGIASIVGDLAESMLKRAAGAKDSSRFLPGHGGLLDRADSLLFAGPALYYYYRLFLEGGP